jgi:hypothetical protein
VFADELSSSGSLFAGPNKLSISLNSISSYARPSRPNENPNENPTQDQSGDLKIDPENQPKLPAISLRKSEAALNFQTSTSCNNTNNTISRDVTTLNRRC